MKHTMILLIAALGLPALAETPDASPDASASESAEQTAIARLEVRLRDRPHDAALHYYLAIRQASAGKADAAIDSLARAQRYGTGLLPITNEHFAAVANHARYRALYRKMWRELPRVTGAPVWHRMQDAVLLPEGIAYDPISKTTFVTSMRRGTVTAIDAAGRESLFLADTGAPLLGATVDASARRLIVMRTNGFLAQTKEPMNRLEAYDIPSTRLIATIAVPNAEQFNDVAVAPTDNAYVSDSAAGAVWSIDWVRQTAKVVVPAGTLPGANGIAVDAHRNAVYVAHSTGIARFALDGTELIEVIPSDTREVIAAIDGLYAVGADLVGVQNVTNPGRVILLHLTADGRRIKAVSTLQSHHHPEFREPTTGAVIGGTLRLLGSTEVSRLQPDRTVQNEESLKGAVIVDVPLSHAK